VQGASGWSIWTLETTEAGWVALHWALDTPVEMVEVAARTRRLLALDLDGDTDLELVALNSGMCVGWDGDLAACEAFPLPETVGIRDARVVDVDGDLRPELVTVASQVDLGSGPGFIELRELDGSLRSTLNLDGLGLRVPFAFGAWDVDRDGQTDLYLCNDLGGTLGGNLLLRGDGAGGFSIADVPGLEVAGDCMGLSMGDVDQRGQLDIFATSGGRDWLLQEIDGGWFEVGLARGLPDMELEEMAWGSALTDMDNDGRVDVVVASADLGGDLPARWPWRYLHQEADGAFVERHTGLNLPDAAGVRAILARDLNGDGVQDLVGADFTRGVPWLFLSDGCTAEGWLAVEAPEGSRVVVEAGGVQRAGLVTGSPGYGATAQPQVWFGLGPAETIEAVTIYVPGQEPSRWNRSMEVRRTLRWMPTEE